MEALEHSPENPEILTTLGLLFLRYCRGRHVRQCPTRSLVATGCMRARRPVCDAGPPAPFARRTNDNNRAFDYLSSSLTHDPRNPRTILAAGSIIQVWQTPNCPGLGCAQRACRGRKGAWLQRPAPPSNERGAACPCVRVAVHRITATWTWRW